MPAPILPGMPPEHHIEIPRTARYFTLGDEEDPTEVWVVLHGYGQLAGRFAERFQPLLESGRRLVVAPEGLSRFYVEGKGGPDSRVGASWMTREDRLAEIDDYLRFLDAVHDDVLARLPRGRVRLTALGYSQGAATAARWALRGRARVDRLVLWAGLLPPDVEPGAAADRLNALDLAVIAGESDEWVMAGLPIMEAALEEAGVRYRLIKFPGGHQLDESTLRSVRDADGDVMR
jgi:predicted esterase